MLNINTNFRSYERDMSSHLKLNSWLTTGLGLKNLFLKHANSLHNLNTVAVSALTPKITCWYRMALSTMFLIACG